MSQAELDQLLADRSLVREGFDDEQVIAFWAKAAASFADSGVPDLSSDGAFQRVYTAALQASFATLAAHGLRVKSTANHYKTFYAIRKLDDALAPHGVAFDEMRATRNDSVYEAVHDEEELAERVAEARAFLPDALTALRAAILAVRPALAPRLPHIR